MVHLDLLVNTLISGVLVGSLYAAIAVGASISFGMLDITNIAHPALVVLGAFLTSWLNLNLGLDPIISGILLMPAFFVLGALLYRVYYESFERHGGIAVRGLAFFFGIMSVVEVGLILTFGVDYRSVQSIYTGTSVSLGWIDIPLRLLVPSLISLFAIGGLNYFWRHSFFGRATMAVSLDLEALQLMGADPIRVKRLAFGLSVATAALAGALLITIQPVEPMAGQQFIGRTFAIVVLGGLGSISGTVLAAIGLGISESITVTFFGPSWAPAVSFGILFLTLAFRPAGLFGK